LVLEIVVKAMT